MALAICRRGAVENSLEHAAEWRSRALQLRALTQWLSHPVIVKDLLETADRWETVADTVEAQDAFF
jgi:hypothetical protein